MTPAAHVPHFLSVSKELAEAVGSMIRVTNLGAVLAPVHGGIPICGRDLFHIGWPAASEKAIRC